MKNYRQWTLAAFIAIFGIIIGFTACDNETNNPELCLCNPKAHLGVGDICGCGGEDCTGCTVKVYGTITDNGGKVINIHRQGNVSDEQAIAATIDIIAAYNGLTPLQKDKINGKIDEIRVIEGDATTSPPPLFL
jgi:hypothetical protein